MRKTGQRKTMQMKLMKRAGGNLISVRRSADIFGAIRALKPSTFYCFDNIRPFPGAAINHNDDDVRMKTSMLTGTLITTLRLFEAIAICGRGEKFESFIFIKIKD